MELMMMQNKILCNFLLKNLQRSLLLLKFIDFFNYTILNEIQMRKERKVDILLSWEFQQTFCYNNNIHILKIFKIFSHDPMMS